MIFVMGYRHPHAERYKKMKKKMSRNEMKNKLESAFQFMTSISIVTKCVFELLKSKQVLYAINVTSLLKEVSRNFH